MSKGSKQRPGTGYAQGYDGIDWSKPIPGVSPAPCQRCGEDECTCCGTEDGPGQDEEIDREQFTTDYCERSNITREDLSKYRQATPCDCGDPSCKGWQMTRKEGGEP